MTKMADQIADAYRAMARRARYRPAAPSDGLGNITVPDEQLDLEGECDAYTRHWYREEEAQAFRIGCCDFSARPALIYTVEAARMTCGMEYDVAMELLKMAAEELERAADRRNGRAGAEERAR